MPAGRATDPSEFVGKVQEKLSMDPVNPMHDTPKRDTVTSLKVSPERSRRSLLAVEELIPVVKVAPSRTADVDKGAKSTLI